MASIVDATLRVKGDPSLLIDPSVVEDACHARVSLCFLNEILHHGKERHDMFAPIGGEFAAHEVKSLHAIGTFIDHRNPRIPRKL